MNALDRCARGLDGFERLLTSVDGRWEAPTPCIEWTVADLAGHVTDVVTLCGRLALGEDFPASGPDPRETAATDPVANWSRARAELTEVLGAADLASEVGSPTGQVPLARMLDTFFLTEVLVHTWDLGVALGSAPSLDPELVQLSDAYVRVFGGDGLEGLYDPSVAVVADADPTTQLMAFLGRAA